MATASKFSDSHGRLLKISQLLAIWCFSVFGTAVAHEHHDDAIPDGEAISPDPIVGTCPQSSKFESCDL